MRKLPVLSPGYVRIQKAVLSVGVVILGIAAVAFVVLPHFTAFEPPAGEPHAAVVLAALCAFRLCSLDEHETIHKALAESAEKKD